MNKIISIDPSTNIEFVWVAGGDFMMGDHCDDIQSIRRNESPVHAVEVDGFWMSKYLVTNKLWNIVEGNSEQGCSLPELTEDLGLFLSKLHPKQVRKLKHPNYRKSLQKIQSYFSRLEAEDIVIADVIKYFKPIGPHAVLNYLSEYKTNDNDFARSGLTWYESKEFTIKISEIMGCKCRLPTEAEWEYAARSGHRTEDNHDISCWYSPINFGKGSSVPVGWMKPNGLGIFDMSGHHREWVSDYYREDYYQISPYNNPKGPESGACKILKRGGDYSRRLFKGPRIHAGALRLVVEA
jgi:formylglycine-generating enzyme required for sulfatase activity